MVITGYILLPKHSLARKGAESKKQCVEGQTARREVPSAK